MDPETHSLLARMYSAPLVKVIANRELCTVPSSSSSSSRSGSRGGPSVRHIELDLTGTNLTYNTADNVMLLPENRSAVVEALAASQGYELDATFVPHGGEIYPFKPPMRVRTVLMKFLDLQGRTSRTQLKKVIPFLKDDDQKVGDSV